MGQWPKNRLNAAMPLGDLDGRREFRFPDIRGWNVLSTTGHRVGRVKEVFVDPNTLEPRHALLHYERLFRFNLKDLLVPWEELILGKDFVQTRWTEEELLPETRAEQEANLREHGGPGRPAGVPASAAGSDEAAREEAVPRAA